MFKEKLRRVLWSFGYDIQKNQNSGGTARLCFDLIKKSHSNCFLDVGANTGQSALEVISDHPKIRVISFEPLPDAHTELLRIATGHKNWEIAPRMALGEHSGNTTIHVSQNSVSSSLLPIQSTHLKAAPESSVIGTQITPLQRLDEVFQPKPTDRIYLKIDTQGFELPVLKGSSGLLKHITALQLELSWRELYQGQTLAPELMQWAFEAGFKLFGLSNGLRDQHTGQLLQSEGFFIRA